jgi:hypothetical protein
MPSLRRPVCALVFLLLCAGSATGQVKVPAGSRPALQQIGSQPNFWVELDANEFYCPLDQGGLCFEGRGTWAGTRVMYDAGLTLAGIVAAAPGCTPAVRRLSNTPACFAWSGDTAAAGFTDVLNLRNATNISGFYDSTLPSDLSSWPRAGTYPDFPQATAFVTDTAIFDRSLIGKKAASEQDSWVLLTSGANLGTGLPLGLTVEQRTLAWNYPFGNEATIYQVFKITNTTSSRAFQSVAETRHFNGQDSLPEQAGGSTRSTRRIGRTRMLRRQRTTTSRPCRPST